MNTRQQTFCEKRFDHVIVGTKIECGNFFCRFNARTQDDDRVVHFLDEWRKFEDNPLYDLPHGNSASAHHDPAGEPMPFTRRFFDRRATKARVEIPRIERVARAAGVDRI